MSAPKLTSQGVRDLNPKPVNGHRKVKCVHLPGPSEVVGSRYTEGHYEVDVYGRYCLKCGEVCK